VTGSAYGCGRRTVVYLGASLSHAAVVRFTYWWEVKVPHLTRRPILRG
jgi:hypothetical protein